MKKIIIDAATSEQRLDKYLKRYFPNAGMGFLYKMLREKKIKLNNSKSDGRSVLKIGDEIDVYFSDDTIKKFMGDGISSGLQKPIDNKGANEFRNGIIYEDKDIILLNKPAGMLSQKSRPEDISACELLLNYLLESKQLSNEDLKKYKPSAVNRLDRNTSGMLLCAKTLHAARELSEIIKNKTVKKEYMALVKNRMDKPCNINAFLRKNHSENTVKISSVKMEGYDRIETSFEPMGYLGDDTLLRVDLKTGKTHQIRAQLSYMGHPIIGDEKYGDKRLNKLYFNKYRLKRQFLHAYRITFPKKLDYLKTVQGKSFIAALPKELEILEGNIIYV